MISASLLSYDIAEPPRHWFFGTCLVLAATFAAILALDPQPRSDPPPGAAITSATPMNGV